jgi:predicted phosphodiesterase
LKLEKVLIIPDVHVPNHDPRCWSIVMNVARLWKPDHCVLLGDFIDNYSVSAWPKDPDRLTTLKYEIAHAREMIDELDALKIRRMIYCEGNHETRLARFVASKAPELHGVTPKIQQLLCPKRWRWIPYGHFARIGKLHFMHDVGHAGPNAARQSVAAFGGSIIFGHTHRAATHYESSVNGDRHVGQTMGWIGDPSAIDYRHRARVLRENQHGFGIARVAYSGGLAWTHFVPILKTGAVVEGQLYGPETKA